MTDKNATVDLSLKLPASPHAPILSPEITEALMASGDLAKLSTAQRNEYYIYRCRSVGLDPAAQPFEYLELDGKLVLYAKKGATDQLMRHYGLSREIVSTGYDIADSSYFTATVSVSDGQRSVEDIAQVWLRKRETPYVKDANDPTGVKTTALAGEALANAKMKCISKAARRAVITFCGLGMMDESEVETVERAKPVQRAVSSVSENAAQGEGERSALSSSPAPTKQAESKVPDEVGELFMSLRACKTTGQLDKLGLRIVDLESTIEPSQYKQLLDLGAKKRAELEGKELQQQVKERF